MAIKLTAKQFFTEKLDTSIEGLRNIDKTYLNEGEAAAEKQFAAYLKKGGLDTARFFSRSEAIIITDELKEEGERILDGWLVSCGVPIHFEGRKNIDWSINPTYNGFKEWTWQLSRHPEWKTLATLFRGTGDERYAEAFEDYFMSWCEQTEAPSHDTSGFSTLSWRSLECGLRLEDTWLNAIMAFISSNKISDHTLACFFRSVWENVDRILDASTSHNWLITEMSGVNAASIAFPFFTESKVWYEYSIGRLESEFNVQIYDDGFQFELTTCYHRVVIKTYRKVISLHTLMGISLSEDFKRKVANLYRVYVKLMMPDKRSPSLNDGSRVLISDICKEVVELMPDFREDFEFLAENIGKEPEFKSILMPYSGFAVMRSGWGTEDSCAILESAPFGVAHQHEDKLEIILHAYGKRLLDDPGTFRYDTSPMRKYITSSYSHNVALVDGLGQNRWNAEKWQANAVDIKAKADIEANFGDNIEIAEGIYDSGFGPDLIAVRHERTLIWHKNGIGEIKTPFYTVFDRFIPKDKNEHTYTLLWHLRASEGKINGKNVTADYGDGVKFTIIGMSEPHIVKGQTEPIFMGWIPNHKPGDNPHYPSPTVNVDYSGAEMSVATVLIPTLNEDSLITGVDCDLNGNITVKTVRGDYTFNKNDLLNSKN